MDEDWRKRHFSRLYPCRRTDSGLADVDAAALMKGIAGKRVMITGGCGDIGTAAVRRVTGTAFVVDGGASLVERA